MGGPCGRATASVPRHGVTPPSRPVVAAATGQLETWLDEQLRAEREALAEELRKQHKAVISCVSKALGAEHKRAAKELQEQHAALLSKLPPECKTAQAAQLRECPKPSSTITSNAAERELEGEEEEDDDDDDDEEEGGEDKEELQEAVASTDFGGVPASLQGRWFNSAFYYGVPINISQNGWGPEKAPSKLQEGAHYEVAPKRGTDTCLLREIRKNGQVRTYLASPGKGETIDIQYEDDLIWNLFRVQDAGHFDDDEWLATVGAATPTPISSSALLRRSSRRAIENLSWWGKLKQALMTPEWDLFLCFMILANTVAIGVEAQYLGEMERPDIYTGNPLELPKEAMTAFEILDWVFGSFFMLEIVLKICGMRGRFFRFVLNWLDLAVILAWSVDRVLHLIQVSANPKIFRVFRLHRVIRLMRLARVLKHIRSFDSFNLLTTVITSSSNVLVASVAILLCIIASMALTFQQAVYPFLQQYDIPHESREEVYRYFGTFTKAFLSLFEMSLGNWVPPVRILADHVSEWYCLLCLPYVFLVHFAVVRVFNGAIVQETFRVTNSDDFIMTLQKGRTMMNHKAKMQVLFNKADISGDGFMTQAEFETIWNEPGLRLWLAAQEVDVKDPKAFFNLLDLHGVGSISVTELIEGVARLKGTARSSDLQVLMRELRELQTTVKRLACLGGGRP